MNFKNLFTGIRSKIFTSIFGISIIPLVIAILIQFTASRHSIISIINQTMQNQVQQIKRLCIIQSGENAKKTTPKTVIFDIIRESKIGNDGYMYVINSAGLLIEHPTHKGESILNRTDPRSGRAYIQDIITAKEGSINYYNSEDNGEIHEMTAVFTHFKEWDWYIVGCARTDDILGFLTTILKIMSALLVVFAVVIAIGSNFIAHTISQPLRKIIDATTKASNGNLTVFVSQGHYVKCHVEKNCTRSECPAYNNRNLACWRIQNTLCKDGTIETRDEKAKNCRNCIVYKKAIRNEIDEIIEAINNMIQTLRYIVRDISISANELDHESVELFQTSKRLEIESQAQAALIEETSSANEQLIVTIENVAVSAETQANRVSQTGASMEELVASTRIVGNNSSLASASAKDTVARAHETETALQATTRSIIQISESSQKIVAIVAIIKDISDKINLLSLNASIEAARAGENGRGFSVVAEEISKLADATAQSTKEIETLIKTSMADVETGSSLVNATAEVITNMIKNIEKAALLIEEIAMSSEEQIKGNEQVMADIEEVNNMSSSIAQVTGEQKITSSEILTAVSKINESIQEIAQSSEIVSEASESMQVKSKKLKSLIETFKI